MRPVRDLHGRPLTQLRFSVTDRCNFRCLYCMPADGPEPCFVAREELLSYEQLARVVRLLVELGVSRVRLTGGEPLLRTDLDRLVQMLAAIPGLDDLALTTNGYLLAPQAGKLRRAGLQRLNLSLDSLDPQVYQQLNGRELDVARVLSGIAAAERAGFGPLKLNCVVIRGVNDGSVVELARHFRGTPHVMRFIEYMDVGNLNRWSPEQVVPADEIIAMIDAEAPLTPVTPERAGEVARRYRYVEGGGEIGVIASVTRPFCHDCDRMRMGPDGQLYTCLFASDGHDLRPLLTAGASDDELRARLASIWRARGDRYSEERALLPEGERPRKVEMFRIGG
ncbi:MAG: GTP 3',8-cyclase MoaA [Candidatus Poseidoniia archaeon]|jgi:cyclic pyranopterin phosphate synthase|nr:GTP 3',8-cyclase MoaA [Candidatus Poseidoniia archaeon]MDP6846773.1 GTP 3',8-cyclase MoaA [Candidatus Poseidoniia archaeon]